MPKTDEAASPVWQQTVALLARREQRKWDSFSWVALRPLIGSLNDRLSRFAPTMVGDLRRRWVDGQDAGSELIVDRTACTSFIVLGDPGEQDASQYVVVPALREHAAEAGFMVICSDVIYPSGDVNDYVDGFYVPYSELAGLPILALPGNHDWYEGLTGFMWHFCGADPLPSSAYGPSKGSPLRERPARLLWRRPARPLGRLQLDKRRAQRAPGGQWQPLQPGPYYAIETRDVLLVCIDTGIDGSIDREQGEWLHRVSAHAKPKLLLTGKPLVVNRQRHPCPITGGPVRDPDAVGAPAFHCVADVVGHPAHRYVACIGGDIHNFQHYQVDGMEHVVSGGGGAYMSATHPIPVAVQGAGTVQPDVPPAKKLFPGEAQSLRHFARLLLPRVWRLVRVLIAVLCGLTAGVAVLRLAGPHSLVLAAVRCAPPVLGAAVALRLFVVRAAWTRTAVYRLLVVGAAFLTGTVIARLTWLLAPDRILAHASAWVGLTACGALLAWMLRLTGWWRPPSPGFQLTRRHEGTLTVRALGAAFVLFPIAVWLASRDGWLTAAALVTTVAAVLGWKVRWQGQPPVPRAAWRAMAPATAYLVQTFDGVAVLERLVVHGAAAVALGAAAGLVALLVLAGAAVVLLCVLAPLGLARAGLVPPLVAAGLWGLWRSCGGDSMVQRAALTAAVVVAGLLVAVFMVDALRRRFGGAYKIIAAGLVIAAGIAAYDLGAFATWLPRAVLAAGVLLTMLVITIVTWHLIFLGAFALLWDVGSHALRDQFTEAEAAWVIRWRAGGTRPPSRRVRRRANIAFPGADRPHGPIQSAVAEIFDSDVPPFIKNFLVVTSEPGSVTITAHVVTGTDDGPPPYVISVPLPGRAPRVGLTPGPGVKSRRRA